jgi:pimeloyl-ACP methyl ester carboxylesterase
MKKSVLLVLALCTALLSQLARAEVVLLVHGYLGDAGSWDRSGVTSILQQQGWQPAGVYLAGPGGIRLVPGQGATGKDKFYSVDLPSEAPILVQVYLLKEILASITARHPAEPIVLVGHSAGGVVARAALVRGGATNVKALVTIASPHLGTGRAEEALDATDIPFPLSLLTDFLGGSTYHTAMRSRSLYVDLVRARPGTFLYWLNSQPHPDIQYVSVVRASNGPGDYVVPAYSQDMNNVPVLRGRSRLVTLPAPHGLEPADGTVIAQLLAEIH